ncbi:MAG: UDP-N-acetylmuramate dehydrogenase [Prevotella sp.]
MKDLDNYPLLAHNTFGMDVSCRRFVEFASVEELLGVLPEVSSDSPLLVIGGGSNLLFLDDFGGTVLHSAVKGIEAEPCEGGVLLRCGSGETWDDVVAYAVAHGWYGMENLSLIPGEVGASAVQNIGAYGVEAKDVIENVETVDLTTGERRVIGAAECDYGYRRSRFKTEWRGRFVITHVTYRLSRFFVPRLDYGNIRDVLARRGVTVPDAAAVRDAVIEIRREKLPDPAVEGNAGSFFMNPVVGRDVFERISRSHGDVPHYDVDDAHVKIPAGWMIDRCGWKGRSLGNAGVHDRQALVLVNRGGATGRDVLALCDAIRSDVKREFGVEINPEVNII